MSLLAALLVGLVFGFGLLLSHMVDPAKVLAFLDLAGPWDPSLALVMVGAIGVAGAGFALAARQPAPLLGPEAGLPPVSGRLDARLVLGSLLFGVGWGLVGICPGPGIVALGLGEGKALAFVAAMMAGMGLVAAIERRR